MRNHLVVMVRAPVLGRVKSRLARQIGRVGAVQFYRRTTGRLLRRLGADPRWNCWLAVTPDHGAALPPAWRQGWRILPQGGGGLGARMLRPARVLSPGPVVVVGSDIPGITATHIARAFTALGAHDLVFGPALDGGFWLVGLRRRPRLLNPFGGVTWSQADTLEQVLARVPTDRGVKLIDRLADVDHAADLPSGQAAAFM
ncbi:MAG: TIGR04282 family arsenosugar biosynthesis glycosyltransferase [Magnetospiraceae bacterium]